MLLDHGCNAKVPWRSYLCKNGVVGSVDRIGPFWRDDVMKLLHDRVDDFRVADAEEQAFI
jgi:hypothetical protein